jgi:hypothetical protein
VGHVETFAAQRSRLPQQSNVPQDRALDRLTFRRFIEPKVAQLHELGNGVAVVDHALAHDLGGMRRQYRHDQRTLEHRRNLIRRDALRLQTLERSPYIGVRLLQPRLPILREIRQHREQHEAANECERVIQRQGVETRVDRVRIGKSAMPIH